MHARLLNTEMRQNVAVPAAASAAAITTILSRKVLEKTVSEHGQGRKSTAFRFESNKAAQLHEFAARVDIQTLHAPARSCWALLDIP